MPSTLTRQGTTTSSLTRQGTTTALDRLSCVVTGPCACPHPHDLPHVPWQRGWAGSLPQSCLPPHHEADGIRNWGWIQAAERRCIDARRSL